MGFMSGKRALIVGVASNRSIAWGIAQAMHREGAQLAFTYQGDKLKGRVEKFAAEGMLDPQFPPDEAVTLPGHVSSFRPELANGNPAIDAVLYEA